MLQNFFGVTPVASAIPPDVSYDTIKIYGEAYIDELAVSNIDCGDLNSKAQIEWETYRILLAHFDNSLEAGNFTNSDLPITKWRVKRRKVGETLFKQLAEIPKIDGISFYIDNTAKSGVSYEYAIFAVSNELESNPIRGIAMTEFFGWILSNTSGTTSYLFDVEVTTDSISVVKKFHTYENNTTYPVISSHQQKYKQGSITTIPYEYNNDVFTVDNTILNALETFINNEETKILRNGSGQVMEVYTSNFNFKYYDQIVEDNQQPYTITFEFIQVGSGE